jgi:hypothetical protein
MSDYNLSKAEILLLALAHIDASVILGRSTNWVEPH